MGIVFQATMAQDYMVRLCGFLGFGLPRYSLLTNGSLTAQLVN